MKSTRMVCSLVVLSSPLCLDAAASSSTAPNVPYWEVEVLKKGSLLQWTSSRVALKPTESALQEAEQSKKYITIDAKSNKHHMLKELKTETPILAPTPHYKAKAVQKWSRSTDGSWTNTPAGIRRAETEWICPSKTLTKEELRQIDGLFISLCIDEQDQRNALIAKNNPELYPKADAPVHHQTAHHLTALQNQAMSSVVGGDLIDHSARIKFLVFLNNAEKGTVDLTDAFSAEAVKVFAAKIKDEATYDKQIGELSARAVELLQAMNLDPRAAYYVRAVLDGFRNYSELHDAKTQRSEDILATAFGTTRLTKNKRSAVVSMVAEVVGAVQDPSPRTGLRSLLGTYEPREVTEFYACMQSLRQETNTEKKEELTTRSEQLLNTIHAEAVKYLNTLVKQGTIVTNDDNVAENYVFEARAHELRNTLRQINELETLQAQLHPVVHVAHLLENAASSSSAV